jgi:dCTP deaminase
MPLYRQVARGYEMVYQPLNGAVYPTHRLADEWNVRHGIYEDMPGSHRHHVDHDKQNNNPWNIVRMEASEHIRYHNDDTYGEGFDPLEHSQSIKEAIKHLWENDPTWRENYSAAQRTRTLSFWHDEAYSETRNRVIEKYRESWTDERRALRSAQMRAYFGHPEHREQASLRSKEMWATASEERHQRQQEIARQIRIRQEITADVLRAALDETGSIRGAARLLNCDRAVFRRFPDVVASFRGSPRYRNHKVESVRKLHGEHDVYCLTVPEAGNFALQAGVFVLNCGIITNVTPFEPAWEGYVTLEISNTTPLPARVYSNEGIAQVLFFEADEECEVSYADKKGKYQKQSGLTLPKL